MQKLYIMHVAELYRYRIPSKGFHKITEVLAADELGVNRLLRCCDGVSCKRLVHNVGADLGVCPGSNPHRRRLNRRIYSTDRSSIFDLGWLDGGDLGVHIGTPLPQSVCIS